jgi:ubiquinone/menaquinone biosynthesis C-methylase UbiE
MEPISDWTLVDKFVHEKGIVNWDAETLEEVPNNSVETIYASHLLEHFPHVRVPLILKRWYDVLSPGGTIILNVPDLEWVCKELLKYEQGYLLEGYYNTLQGEHGLLSIFYGSQSHEGEFHKSGYTETSITDLLSSVGFQNIFVRKEVEAHAMGCLIVEAVK